MHIILYLFILIYLYTIYHMTYVYHCTLRKSAVYCLSTGSSEYDNIHACNGRWPGCEEIETSSPQTVGVGTNIGWFCMVLQLITQLIPIQQGCSQHPLSTREKTG